MSFKYGVLCLFLLFVIILLAIKSYEAWVQPLELIPNKGTAKRSEAKAESVPVRAVAKEPTPVVPFSSIAEKNIFNPERKDFPIMVTPGIPVKPLARPQVTLYGVTIAGSYQAASIVQTGRPLQKGERETITLKLGERIGEYKLTKISSDRVTLETDGDSFEVFLYDPKMPKRRVAVRTETTPAAITSMQPVSTPPSPAPPATPPSPATPRETAIPVPPRVPVQERVTAPTPPSPGPSSLSAPEVIRRRRVIYPPTGGSTPTTGEMNEN
jgi:hypothetical protein